MKIFQKLSIFVLLLSLSTINFAQSGIVIPIKGGSVLPRGILKVLLNDLQSNVDYDIYCNIYDNSATANHSSINIAIDEVYVKKLDLNGSYSEHFPSWWGILPLQENMLSMKLIKYGSKNSGSIQFRNYDSKNTITVGNCRAYLSN